MHGVSDMVDREHLYVIGKKLNFLFQANTEKLGEGLSMRQDYQIIATLLKAIIRVFNYSTLRALKSF